MKGLAEDGNEVTFISPVKPKNTIENLKEIYLDITDHLRESKYTADPVHEMNCFDLTSEIHNFDLKHISATVHNPVFKDFLRRKESFDVVIVQFLVGNALLSLGHHFNAPIIAVSPSALNTWTRNAVGAPNLASFVPNMLSGHSDRMNFWQRIHNSLCYLYEDVKNPLVYTPAHQTILNSMYSHGKKIPSHDDFMRNISLVLYNSHPVFEHSAPTQHNVIPVGGLFIDRKNPLKLPNDIETFLNDATGVIYIAFGSNMDFSMFHQHRKDAIINAINEYPHMRIILLSKTELSIPSHKLSDVMIRPWFPQQAILAHQKVKLFITHGGMLSTIEAIHFAKPIIGISVYYDQHLNMKNAAHRGFGIHILYNDLTTEILREAIRTIFTDPSYIQQTQISSYRYWNQMKSPLDTAIFWVKYVAENKGAPHLRSIGIDMPFYVYYNLDCYAFVVACCILTIFIFIKLTKTLFSRLVKWLLSNKLNKLKLS